MTFVTQEVLGSITAQKVWWQAGKQGQGEEWGREADCGEVWREGRQELRPGRAAPEWPRA